MADIWGDGIVLPPHTLESGADGVDASVPPHTLSSGADGVASALPPHTSSADASWTGIVSSEILPAHSISASMTDSASAENQLAPHASDGYVLSGETLEATVDLPPHSLDADCGMSSVIGLKPHEITASIVVGEIATLSEVVPAHLISASVVGSNFALASSTLAAHAIAAYATVSSVSSLSAILRPHSISAYAFSGSSADANNELPPHEMSAAAFAAYILQSDVELPAHQLSATASQSVADLFRTWALNTRKSAVTEYTGFEFNSFAVVDGRVYAANENGIYELGSQDTDAGTAIPSTVRTGKHDFGTSYLKRVPRLYLGYQASGDLEFSTITSDTAKRTYLLQTDDNTETHQRRVPIGMGPKSRYWQFEIKNRNGSDFSIDDIEAYPVKVRTRVQ